MRLAGFIIALLLLGGAVDPTRGWLIALVVVTGLAVLRVRPWRLFQLRPALDVRLGALVLAALLLAGTVDPTREWLIALTAVTGVAAFMPGLVSLDGPDRGTRWDSGWRRGRRRSAWAERCDATALRSGGGDDWSWR